MSILGPGREFDLIRGFLERARSRRDSGVEPALNPSILLGPGDDCAVVEAGTIAISTDLCVEGVHFRREWLAPEDIGFRASVAALSDLAAMAASPLGLLVSLAVPSGDAADFAHRIMDGVSRAAAGTDAVLLGGDLARAVDGVVLDVVVLGSVEGVISRAGALPGDEIWVTGRLGAAAAAVACWESGREPSPEARKAFAAPTPRIAESRWLARRGLLNSLIDLSDGLAGDVGHIAAASGVAAVVDAAGVPIHQAVREMVQDEEQGLDLALAGGEDYELCFTASAGAVRDVAREFFQEHGVELSLVGNVVAGSGVSLRMADGSCRPLGSGGYRHFEAKAEET